MTLEEKHQLAKELTMEFIRQNQIFNLKEDVCGKHRSLNQMSHDYFDMYDEFRNAIDEFAEQFCFG